MPILEVNQVHTYYGNIQALKGVSLTVEKGEIVTLIGSNGAGKTTTLRTIAGVLRPRKGTVRLGDRDLTKVPANEIVRLGLAHSPEGRRIFSRMSVKENLEMGAYARSDPPAELAKDFERVYELFPRLKERLTQRAGTLSGGEQQMLAIGRALMSRPKLILLDEPSMGLAPVMVLRLFDLIRRIRAESYTILVVEQNVRQVLKLVDRAYLLEVGRISMEGRADELSEQEFVRKAYVGL
jgi:branched-chain amino acid transport system ATP-binding protein